MRLIKSATRSSTGRFASKYTGKSAPDKAALAAVIANNNEYFVSTLHLPQ